MKPDITGIRKRLEDHSLHTTDCEEADDYRKDASALLAYVSELEGQLKIAVNSLIEISKDTVELTPWKSQASNPAIIANDALEKIDERFRT